MSLEFAITVFISFFVSFFLILWSRLETLRCRDIRSQKESILFHCIKCGHLYSGKSGQERSDCPKCHFNNIRLRF